MVFSQKPVSRYQELKNSAVDCILFIQVGAFMQVMNDDARTVAGITGLKRWPGTWMRPLCWAASL